MKIFIPDRHHKKIVKILKEWKMLDMNGLKDLYSEICHSGLYKKMKHLEDCELVKSFTSRGNAKYFFLKDEHLHRGRKGKKRFERILKHDLLTAKVLREILKWPECRGGKILGQVERDFICPDAEFVMEDAKTGEKIRVALEVEVTRKSYYRIRKKFTKYQMEREFDRVLFVTNEEGIFKAYSNYLMELHPEIQKKIGLLFDENLSPKSFDCQNSPCFYMGKINNLSALFTSENSA